MSRVFMDFAASGEILFKARCGAKDFLDKLRGLLVQASICDGTRPGWTLAREA